MSRLETYIKSSWPLVIILILVLIWQGMKHYVSGDQNVSHSIYTSIAPQKETCMDCHIKVVGFSKFHDPNLIGCVVCHLGNGQAQDKSESHDGMVLIPGNLSNAEHTCGTCHPKELYKINKSLMTTNSGIVAVDKYIFGEADSPDHHYDIRTLDHSPSDDHLRNLCANCHLGAEKQEFGKIDQLSRGGGCNACHLNYSEEAERHLQNYLSSSKQKLPTIHPSTDIFMGDEHCFGCHSRSSRISTNYMGWHETLMDEEQVTDTVSYKVFQDKRVYQYKGNDVHHAQGLLCIDCHSSHEVMGDGKSYLHEEDAVSLTCSDCHYKNEPNTMGYNDLDTESLLVFMHRGYTHSENKMLRVFKDGHPLVNTFIADDELYLIGKKDRKKHRIKPQGETCSRDTSHKDLTCSTCHSSWAPRCIGCHNTFEENKEGFDLLDKKLIQGTWTEHVFEFDSGLPAFGVRENKDTRKIEPAIPGMILSIDHDNHEKSAQKKDSFERLYAANSPHTTSKKVRSCATCHADPSALGYGQGVLSYLVGPTSGEWVFEPKYESNPVDGLPEDAWIPFLKDPDSKKITTRSDFRPLSIEEQERILLVGACLQCHPEDSEIMKESLKSGINPLLLKLSERCILPEF